MNLNNYEKRLMSKGHPWLKKKAIEYFNAFIRARDARDDTFVCISCQTTKDISKMNAGHYYPSVHESTRFDEDDCHGQCIHCNLYKHGNLTHYRIHLEKKIGKDRLEKLDWKHSLRTKRDRYDLMQIILKYKQK